ncbi:MAG: S8 family serine peptidase [Deltaproteobacteria bacterium]|nr:S8 family serine peptidase [Deltaproteobacteria bacterium]
MPAEQKHFFFLLSFIALLFSAPSSPSAETLNEPATKIIVAFDEGALKAAVRKKKSLETALRPLVPSGRARAVAAATLGRLKRKLAGEIQRGSQLHLSLIDAKLITPVSYKKIDYDSAEYLQSAGLIRYAERDIELHASLRSNDPEAALQWALNNDGTSLLSAADVDINAEEAWQIRTSSDEVAIAILDTGFDPLHPDLRQNAWVNKEEVPANGVDDDNNGFIDDVHGCNFVVFSPASGSHCGAQPYSNNYHGTHVAGVAGARGNNGVGVSGVAWQTKLVSIAFLDEKGSGTLSDMIEGMQYAITLKQSYTASAGRRGANIKVINASFGHGGGFSQAEFDAIKAAAAEDIFVVAAAGNGGFDGLGDNNDLTPVYPAGYDLPNVISVASIGAGGKLSPFSNFGANSVHIAAPGERIVSTVFGGYSSLSGTSMAAPHVSGAAALWLAERKEMPAWGAKEALIASVKDRSVLARLDSLQGAVSSGGMLDLKQALLLGQDSRPDLRILQHPADAFAVAGDQVRFTVSASSSAPISYQWRKDGVLVSGATNASLQIAAVTAKDSGSYDCLLSSAGVQLVSSAAYLHMQIENSSDVTRDGRVDHHDLVAVMKSLGKRGKRLKEDVNGDKVVDLKDLSIVFANLSSRFRGG